MSSSSHSRIVSVPVRRHRRGFVDRLVGHGSDGGREVDLEGRAETGLGVDLHVPAGLGDDAVDRREPEAGAVAGLLGGEERLEDVLETVRRDPRAGVRDGQAHVALGRDQVLARVVLVEVQRAGLERDRAAGRHRVARVDGEVDDHLLDLRAVGEDRRETVGKPHDDPDVLADQPVQHRRQRQCDLAEIERRRLQDLLAREGEQLARELRGALRGAVDLAAARWRPDPGRASSEPARCSRRSRSAGC